MNKKLSKRLLKGITLMEIVVCIGISVLVLSALIALGSASVKSTTSSSRRIEAEKLSSSGIEAARYVRDSLGYTALASGCYRINGSALVSVVSGACTATQGWEVITLPNNEIFERRIQIQNYPIGTADASATSKIVTSDTRWVEALGGAAGTSEEGFKNVVLSVILSNWQ